MKAGALTSVAAMSDSIWGITHSDRIPATACWLAGPVGPPCVGERANPGDLSRLAVGCAKGAGSNVGRMNAPTLGAFPSRRDVCWRESHLYFRRRLTMSTTAAASGVKATAAMRAAPDHIHHFPFTFYSFAHLLVRND